MYFYLIKFVHFTLVVLKVIGPMYGITYLFINNSVQQCIVVHPNSAVYENMYTYIITFVYVWQWRMLSNVRMHVFK